MKNKTANKKKTLINDRKMNNSLEYMLQIDRIRFKGIYICNSLFF